MKPANRARRSSRSAGFATIPPTMDVIQRSIWNGSPQEEATWWTLSKAGRHAVCRMFSHPLGHELRLELAGELFLSEVCRNDDDVLRCQERWRAGLEEKGWAR
jgi:hypothetical protein